MTIGRTRELDLGRELLLGVSGGEGRVLLLTGEAGVGKTHLLALLGAEARARGFELAVGRCFADAEQRAFGPWREAFGSEAASPIGAGRLGAQDDRARAFEAVLAELARRAESAPLCLALEDLHWADRDSIELVLHVARFGLGRAVLLIGTVRTPDLDGAENQPLDRVLAELVREPRCRRVSLGPFAPEEVLAYSESLVGGAVPQSLVRALYAETGGNALYVLELVRHLLEEGKLQVRDGRLATDFSVSELGLPPSLRHVVRQRAARLSADALALLRAASVAFGPSEHAVLCRVAEVPAARALDALDQLLASGLLRAEARRYDVAHAIVRRALYEDLNPERQAELHRRFAEALAACSAPDPADTAAHYHASRGLAGAEAGVPFALRESELARAAGAPERAATFLSIAAELGDALDGATRAGILERLAVARAEALDPDGAVAAVEAATLALARAGASERVPAVLALTAAALADGGAPRSAWEPLVRRGLAAVGSRRDAAWARLTLLARPLVPVLSGALAVSRYADHDAGAVALLRQGSELELAASVDPHDLRTREETRELLRASEHFQEPAALLRVLDACMRDTFFRANDFRLARTLAERLHDVAAREGSLSGCGTALILLGCCRAALGDLAGAEQDLAAARAATARLGSLHRMSTVGPLALECTIACLAGGTFAELAARCLGFLGSPRAATTPFGIVPLNLGLVTSALAGDGAEVLRLVPSHLEALAALPPGYNERGATRDCGVSAIFELGDARFAERYLELAEREPELAGSAAWSSLSHARGRLFSLLGQIPQATAAFAQARGEFTAEGRTPALALCDYDEALTLIRHGQGEDARVAELRARAVAGFDALGMTFWSERARGLDSERPATPELPDGLTQREIEVLRLLAGGLANKEIALRLFVSVPTVERHIGNIYDKVGARGRAAATAYALRKGLV